MHSVLLSCVLSLFVYGSQCNGLVVPYAGHLSGSVLWGNRLGSAALGMTNADDAEIADVNGLSDDMTESSDAESPAESELMKEVLAEDSLVATATPEEPMFEGGISEPLSESQVTEYFLFLQSLAAITSRGEQATDDQLNAARSVVAKLEAANPTAEPAKDKYLLEGTWNLAFTDTRHLFRSSPFFMAGRAVCQTKEQLEQYEWFCTMHRKALAISQISAVRQVITPTQLISEFEVQAGAVPFLSDFTPFMYSGGMPLTIDGAIVSTADLSTINATAYELYMDTVQIKGSNLPGLRQILDNGLELQSRMLGDFLETNIDRYSNPRPVVRTTYLSEQFRISRDMDDNIFVYVKTSDAITPTDYSKIDADLGIGRLVDGFNKAVTKIDF